MSTFYYQAFHCNVSVAGTYSFESNSSMDTFAYMYNNSFIPPTPLQYLLASDNDGAGKAQFRVNVYLDTTTAYILVVTTVKSNITGSFSIIALGFSSVTFSSINASGENLISFGVT